MVKCDRRFVILSPLITTFIQNQKKLSYEE
jgi:hypothetical protein